MKKLLFTISTFLFFTLGYSQFGNEQIITTEAIDSWLVRTGDINGDGFTDAIVSSIGDNTIAWYPNVDGAGNFGNKHVVSEFIFEDLRYFTVVDIDNDGDLDIAATAVFDDLVMWFRNEDGLGNFSDALIITDILDSPQHLSFGDIDNDGDLDLVCPSRLDGKITWFKNSDGLGNFVLEQTVSSNIIVPLSTVLTDLDNDGDLDLISNSGSGATFVSWYKNLDGLGTFGTEQVVSTNATGSEFVSAADIDNDGDQDIIDAEFGGNTIAWYENLDGLGTFGTKNIIANPYRPYEFAVADIDNDGDLDIVSHHGDSFDDYWISWYKNDGAGNFSSAQIIDDFLELSKSVSVGYIDSDNYIDVLSTSIVDYTAVWYKNQTYLGAEDQPLQNITLYPNPAQNILHINNPKGIAIKRLQVYNMLGKKVLETALVNNSINVSSLQSGLYVVKISTANGVSNFKMVKK